MAEKVKLMKLEVDLECEKCCKKVKRVLSKFPEIRDQVYHQKQNIVTIKVVSCCPEKIRDKLHYRGGDSIRSIEIVDPPKPKPPEPEKEKAEEKTKPKPQPKTEATPAQPTKPATAEGPPPVQPKMMFPEPAPVSVLAYPAPVQAIPVGLHYEGPVGYPGFYGRPVFDSYGGGRPSYVGQSDQFFSEENASGCTIM